MTRATPCGGVGATVCTPVDASGMVIPSWARGTATWSNVQFASVTRVTFLAIAAVAVDPVLAAANTAAMPPAVNTCARIDHATPVADEPHLAPAAPTRAAAMLSAVDAEARVGRVRAAKRQSAQ